MQYKSLLPFLRGGTVVNFVQNSEEIKADKKYFRVLMKNDNLKKYAQVTELLEKYNIRECKLSYNLK
jgi:hypothetical protein